MLSCFSQVKGLTSTYGFSKSENNDVHKAFTDKIDGSMERKT